MTKRRHASGLRVGPWLALLAAMTTWCVGTAHGEDGGPAQPVLSPPVWLEGTAPETPVGVALDAAAFVLVELTVDEQGLATDAVVIESAGPELDAAALATLASLRFEPALRDGVPIAARIPFRFDFPPSPAKAPVESAPPPAPLPAPAASPTPSAPDEPVIVEAVTLEVRGERPPREPTAHRIEAKDARTLPGTGGDPMRALETMPGVARPPGLSGQLVVRGSAPEDTAVFVDGIAVPYAYHFGGISSVIPTEALSHLDFRPGNFGAEYGRAMGGVVELGLRSPERERLAAVAQVDTLDGRLLVQGPLGSRTRLLAGIRRSWVDAWLGKVLSADDISLRTAPAYWDGQAILEHDVSQRTRARLSFFGSDDRLALIARSPDPADPVLGGRVSVHTRFTRVALRIDSDVSDRIRSTTTAAYGTDVYDLRFGTNFSDFRVHQFQLRSELGFRVAPWLRTSAGVDTLASRYELLLRVRPYESTDEAPGPYFARPSQTFDETVWLVRPAVYALAELTPTAHVRIVPGVRADYTHDTERVTVDPRVTARIDVHDAPRTMLKSGLGLYHQPPQPQESVEPFGTPSVRSNRAVHSSLGVEQELLEGFTWSVDGFYKHLRDLVIARAAEDTQAIGTRFENTGTGRAYGAELLVRYQPRSRLTGWLAYTLSRSERQSADGEPFHLTAWDQTHILSAMSSADVGLGITLGARFRYVTGAPYTPYVGSVLDLDAGAYAPVASPELYSARLSDFHQLDLRAEKTWVFSAARLSAYLELRNAYNRKNAEAVSYSYDYRESRAQEGLPILPVVGLRGEL